MASPFTEAEIQEQIAILKAQLAEVNTAISKALEAQQYSLDTGQTRQSVQRAQLSQLRKQKESILADLQRWQDQLSGGGGTYARPAW